MALPDFDRFDLSSFRLKYCTSAPFSAALKADVLARWPGGLIEYYGMTEGGGTCILAAIELPDKLHTVGQPLPRATTSALIDDDGNEVAAGRDRRGRRPLAGDDDRLSRPPRSDRGGGVARRRRASASSATAMSAGSTTTAS